MRNQRTLIRAAMIADGDNVWSAPGAVLLEGPRIIASGPPESIGPAEEAGLVELPRSVLIPALINTHCRLDQSHVRPIPYAGDYRAWLEHVCRERASTDKQIADSVRRGIELFRLGGTAIVGDVAALGSTIPLKELRDADLAGVSFAEFSGAGLRQEQTVKEIQEVIAAHPDDGSAVRLGLRPRSPCSCGETVYFAAAALGRPLATTIAETIHELEFVATGTGLIKDMLVDSGQWDQTMVGRRMHPIDWVAQSLACAPFVLAHLNYVEERHFGWLEAWNATVAYCPRASAYFDHPQKGLPQHQYRQMIERGVNVALGTGSPACLDTAVRTSILDEMRLLHRRDGTDARSLLKMATVAGARGLGFDQRLVTLAAGPTAGILAVPCTEGGDANPIVNALQSNDPPNWVWGPIGGSQLERD